MVCPPVVREGSIPCDGETVMGSATPMNRLRAQRSGAPEQTPFLKRSAREEPEPLGPAGKKGGCDGFIRGAIPIGRNAKEQEIGPTDISGTGLAHLMAPDDTTLQPAKTAWIRADIDIVPNRDKSAETHPDLPVAKQGIETGAGWVRRGENSGKDYVSLSLAAPEFGPRKLYANLGRAAGQDDDSVFAVIWNPAD
jgi:uncharacterized protein (DUF736 family)